MFVLESEVAVRIPFPLYQPIPVHIARSFVLHKPDCLHPQKDKKREDLEKGNGDDIARNETRYLNSSLVVLSSKCIYWEKNASISLW